MRGKGNDLRVTMSKRLRSLRDLNGADQAVIARRAGIKRQSLATLEGGKNFPRVPNLVALAEIYGTSVDYILGRTELMRLPTAEELGVSRYLLEGDSLLREILEEVRRLADWERRVIVALCKVFREEKENERGVGTVANKKDWGGQVPG